MTKSSRKPIHHVRGRVGRLLLWEPGWLPVSFVGHLFIHDHPEQMKARLAKTVRREASGGQIQAGDPQVEKRPMAASEGLKSPSRRIRQSSAPLMNRLETAFHEHLKLKYPNTDWHPQGVTLKLCNGLRYSPDFLSFDLKLVFETKGKWIDGDSIPKLKMAATVYPELRFWLVWRDAGVWREQEVLR